MKRNNGVFIIHSKIFVVIPSTSSSKFSLIPILMIIPLHSLKSCLLTLLLSTQNRIDQRRVLDQSHLNIDKSMLVKDLFVFRCRSFLSSCG